MNVRIILTLHARFTSMRFIFLSLALMLLCLNSTFAQQSSPTPAQQPSPTPSPTATEQTQEEQFRDFLESQRKFHLMKPSLLLDEAVKKAAAQTQKTLYEVQLGWGVLGFGVLLIGLEIAVMLRLKKGWGHQSIRIVGLTLVLTSGLFLIVTGYSQDQIAPMIGLLGTIIGFLLGKTSKDTDTE